MYGYRNEPSGVRRGQSGPSYPSLQNSNPLQEVRDLNRMPQEDSYKMQPGRFMPAVNPTAVDMASDSRATIRSGGARSGDQNFDVRSQSFASLDANLREQWIPESSVEITEGRK